MERLFQYQCDDWHLSSRPDLRGWKGDAEVQEKGKAGVPTRLEGMETSIHRKRFENASPSRPDLRGWKLQPSPQPLPQPPVPTRLEGMETAQFSCRDCAVNFVPTRLEGMETHFLLPYNLFPQSVPTRLEGMETPTPLWDGELC